MRSGQSRRPKNSLELVPRPQRLEEQMPEIAMAKVRLLVLPYGSAQAGSLVELLVSELNGGRWSRFAAAVAFARQSANYVEFLDALEKFAAAGNRVDLTFG